jgi:hypothetical protein
MLESGDAVVPMVVGTPRLEQAPVDRRWAQSGATWLLTGGEALARCHLDVPAAVAGGGGGHCAAGVADRPFLHGALGRASGGGVHCRSLQ